MQRKEPEVIGSITDNVSIYLAYLLRYIPDFPVTAAELQKKAADKHFGRLARYLGELPPEQSFKRAQDVLDLLKHNDS